MLKYKGAIAVIGVLALGALFVSVSGKTVAAPASGSWHVDAQHSTVQLITDGTTDFGKRKITYTLGFARVNGDFKLDDANLDASKLDLHIYPANSSAPVIGEDGKYKTDWLANQANHTLMCFHSKKITRGPDGKLQVTGDLVLTRVDRNVDIEPTEAYSGPTYGPPVVHRVVRPATFVLDLAPAAADGKLAAGVEATGQTSMSRESYPELVKAAVATYWPPVVMDEQCQNGGGGTEDYRGSRCTGTFMDAPGLPVESTRVGEDYPGASDFNAISGNQLTILLRLRLSNQPGPQTAHGM